jgi:thioredoxin-dependent peroxiredoxin
MISINERIDLTKTFKYTKDGVKNAGALQELCGERTVFTVYMKNNTSACDRQIEDLVEHYDDLRALGLTIVGLSKDSVGSHLKYAAAKEIPFALVSDPEKIFAQMTDSLVEKSMYGKKYLAPARAAYLVDAEGTVRGLISEVDPKNHAEQVRQLVQSL